MSQVLQFEPIVLDVQQSPTCPSCCSAKVFCNGHRELKDGTQAQRYLCRECGHRFSESHNLKTLDNIIINSQIGTSKTVKNLCSATETKTVAAESIGIRPEVAVEIELTIEKYKMTLKNKGRTADAIRTYSSALTTLTNKGADIFDPSSVEHIIANQAAWSLRAKKNYVDWYARFAKYMRYDWEKPIYKAPDKIAFIPYDIEVEQLIAGLPRLASIACHIGKETAARIGEVVEIEWADIDAQNSTIAINHPEKGSYTGIYKVSNELMLRIAKLPKRTRRVLGSTSSDSIANMLLSGRKKLSHNLNNNRFLQIHFHTLRHWKLTKLAYETKDPFIVQQFARHHDMKITMKYINLARAMAKQSDSDEWIIRVVKTLDEAIALGEVGFVPFATIEGVQLFRKHK